jgi:hypothetical protein
MRFQCNVTLLLGQIEADHYGARCLCESRWWCIELVSARRSDKHCATLGKHLLSARPQQPTWRAHATARLNNGGANRIA